MAKINLGKVVGNIADATVIDLLGYVTGTPGGTTTAQNMFNVLETKNRDIFDMGAVAYVTNFLEGEALTPGRNRVYMENGDTGNAPTSGAQSGEVTIITADNNTYQIYLDSGNRYWCNIFPSNAPAKNWVKIGGSAS